MFITGLLIAILTIVGIVYSRLITTFFHELGHAIPALAFSSKQVTMYVGSYGNPDKSWTLSLGRLKMILSFNIWDLQLGLCTHSGKLSNTQSLIIIFGGPLLSLIFAAILIGQIATSGFLGGYNIYYCNLHWVFNLGLSG